MVQIHAASSGLSDADIFRSRINATSSVHQEEGMTTRDEARVKGRCSDHLEAARLTVRPRLGHGGDVPVPSPSPPTSRHLS